MLVFDRHSPMFLLLILSSFVVQCLCDLEVGFSRGCYTACPRKTWNLQNSSRQQQEKQWIECLKDCRQVNSWKYIIILAGVAITIAGTCILIYICYGEKIRLRYIFHIERNRRKPITSEDQNNINAYKEALQKYKQVINEHQVCIQFQNDKNQLKRYQVADVIFQQKKEKELQNVFSIIIISKKQTFRKQSEGKPIQLQQQSRNQLKQQEQDSSRLVGAISLTSKGLNLWWIKIDDKPQNPGQKCKFCTRRNQKIYAVYEKDPYAPENSYIGNAVLLDSTKPPQQRFTRYFIRKNKLSVNLKNLEEIAIAA